MKLRNGLAASGLVVGVLLLSSRAGLAETSAAAEWFDEAVRSDAAGNARLAFSLYRRAAEIGSAPAEFNVAVMLDSGRGVHADPAEAATWYARAAAHGDARAAYNLGQLYEAGDGVPKNVAIARAWFAASGLAAARTRLAAIRTKTASGAGTPLVAPHPVAPAAGGRIDPRARGVEFVWTSAPQPEPMQYYVELRALDAGGSHEVFSSFAGTSSVFARMPLANGAYAWRVTAVAQTAGQYLASDWLRFKVHLPPAEHDHRAED